MTNTIFALMLIFTPANGEPPIGVPLGRDMDFVQCIIERDDYLTEDPDTQAIVVCLEQDTLNLPPLKGN